MTEAHKHFFVFPSELAQLDDASKFLNEPVREDANIIDLITYLDFLRFIHVYVTMLHIFEMSFKLTKK